MRRCYGRCFGHVDRCYEHRRCVAAELDRLVVEQVGYRYVCKYLCTKIDTVKRLHAEKQRHAAQWLAWAHARSTCYEQTAVCIYIAGNKFSLGLSSDRPGKVTTNLPGRPAPKISRKDGSLWQVCGCASDSNAFGDGCSSNQGP